ncbi:platelet-activating factor acetylhydrolase [Orycteropus afer afer]|uniref:Platelet-activating factor acetylhydrolase n=1 Tax=Orycteropus afer afer TaxID=1230840 RepID=A0A8B6ZHB1_ORYAF|nr:platelet-activating factor acetylhydrolase [Orycteropus afer afer]
MVPSKLHMLICLCNCFTLIHPFDWQSLNPAAQIQSSAWINKIQDLMVAANLGQTKIPKGDGSYSVGCTDLMFDYTNKGSFLRLYYPSQDDDHSDTLWIPNKEYFWGLSKLLGTHSLMATFLELLFGSMTTPAKWNSPLRTGEKYPLIVFSHGLGAFRTIYSAIGNDLASHGFIVAAVEHRDGSASATYYFKDQSDAMKGDKSWLYFKTLKRDEEEARLRNEQVQQRAKECSQALNLILDIDHGKPVKNALDLEFDVKQLKVSFKKAIFPLFLGAVHQNFDDFTFATGQVFGYLFKLKGDIDSNVAIDLTNKASLAFLQKHLGLQKDFDQWDSLIEGEDENLIPGTNINTTSQHVTTLQNLTEIGK